MTISTNLQNWYVYIGICNFIIKIHCVKQPFAFNTFLSFLLSRFIFKSITYLHTGLLIGIDYDFYYFIIVGIIISHLSIGNMKLIFVATSVCAPIFLIFFYEYFRRKGAQASVILLYGHFIKYHKICNIIINFWRITLAYYAF